MPLSRLKLDELIFKDQIRFLYGHAMASYWGSFLLSVLLAVLIWDDEYETFLLVWIGAVTALFLLRWWLHVQYRLSEEVLSAHLRANIFTMGAVVSGALWGIAGWVVYDPAHQFNAIMIMILINGMAGGVVISLSSHPPAYFGFTLSSILPVMAKMIYLGGSHNMGLLLLEVVSFALLFSWHKNTHRNLYRLFKLQIENAVLMQKIQTESELTKEAQREAERSNDEKSTFIAAASHDLRQPLFAIQLNANLLSNRALQPEAFDKCLNGIHRDVQNLTSMFNDLLDVSKLDSGMMQPIYSEFDVDVLMQGVLEEFRGTHAQQIDNVRVINRVPRWVSDPIFMKRIVQNLLENAFKFSSGKILVVLKPCGSDLCLRIYDQGIGMTQEQIQQVFKEYYQVGNKGRNRKQGFGMGLSIVKRLVESLEGEISLSSVYGKGSVFKIRIPNAISKLTSSALNSNELTVRNASHEQPRVQLSLEQLESIKLLLVDDDEMILEPLESFWAEQGVQVYSANSVADAVQLMESRLFDVIISDYRLVDGTGIEIMSVAVQKMPKSLRFILTGDTTFDFDGNVAQDVVILHKPLAPEYLFQEMQSRYLSVNV